VVSIIIDRMVGAWTAHISRSADYRSLRAIVKGSEGGCSEGRAVRVILAMASPVGVVRTAGGHHVPLPNVELVRTGSNGAFARSQWTGTVSTTAVANQIADDTVAATWPLAEACVSATVAVGGWAFSPW